MVTIEGLAGGHGDHPVQHAWKQVNVPQCGYCQPGQIMQAAALLAQTPKPTDLQIDDAMMGNICRCGTYQRIKAALGGLFRATSRARHDGAGGGRGADRRWTVRSVDGDANPQQARQTVADAIGLDQSKVTINVTLLGGGFGRKSKPDYVAEAAYLANAIGAPVKVTWTREDDIRHEYYRAACAQHLEAGFDADGQAVAWLHRRCLPVHSDHFHAERNLWCRWRDGPGCG